MLETKATNKFKRDTKLCSKRGLDMRKKYKNHILRGRYDGSMSLIGYCFMKLMRSIFICYELVHILIYLINIELTKHVRKIFLHAFLV
ncbi:hypothetical protein GCM10025886_13970 [Tetragenococcus halophilus subsp. flandriensis]|uniref:hypothetical protein n=1 Tax=Tetragenococcus halophilus TaxID=51669 RepID=UPI0023E91B6D|nr:hypothetical protein GCM10025886_13970 [Tetragenococcus halophilus subsp. flandriensis]